MGPVFTLSMLLVPAIASLFFRPRQGVEVDLSRVRRLRLILWITTASAVAAYWGLWAASGPRAEWPASLVAWTGLSFSAIWATLWFVLAMRLLQACGHGDEPRAHLPSRRRASLVNRATQNPVPPRAWIPPALVWFAAVVLVTSALTDPPAGNETRTWLAFVLLLTVVPQSLLFAPWVVRRSLEEPEPLDPDASTELLEAYGRLRRVKAWGFYGLHVATMLMACALLSMLALSSDDGATMGIAGGVAGSVIGVGGAVFGCFVSARRLALRRMLEGGIRPGGES